MISDVFFEAIEEIGRYRRDFPGVYDDPDLSERIDRVVIAMDALRAELDRCPDPDAEPEPINPGVN